MHENNLEIWYKEYLKFDGIKNQLSFSSDAGVSSLTELWTEVRKCALYHDIKFFELLPHLTSEPAKALKLSFKGTKKMAMMQTWL